MKAEPEGLKTLSTGSELPRPIIGKDGRFDNPWPTWQETSLNSVFKFAFSEWRSTPWLLDNSHPSMAELATVFPVSQPDLKVFTEHSVATAVRALWVGHATVLVQLGGLNFLTDPVFSERCSPFSFAGPRRFVKPAFSLDDPDLPKLDFILISHNHYDHLDYASVKQLTKRFGNGMKWYVPLKLGGWFEGAGVPKECVVEMDWWQEVQHVGSDVTIAFTPAQHWSNRSTDRRHTLWGGFAITAGAQRFWYSGDTGYCTVFEQIGRRYGPFDLAVIPIGAYAPRWFMKSQHVNPEEAVQIHKDVRSQRSIGVHCCTFPLTNEAVDEPPKVLADEAQRQGLGPDDFVTLVHGGHILTAGGCDLDRSRLLGEAAKA